MVSRRNFFTITIIMLILIFMFQIPEVVKDRWNDYGENAFEEIGKADEVLRPAYTASEEEMEENGRYAVYLGDLQDGSIGTVVGNWSFYTKRYLESYESLEEYRFEEERMPEVLILDSNFLNYERDVERLQQLVEQGVNLIFCNLPEVSVLAEESELMNLLGIRFIRSRELEVEGLHLFAGLLLGGEKYYIANNEEEEKLQDLELTMPWYHVSSGTKTYMVGMLDEDYMNEQDIENEDLPAVIWRNSIGKVRVFAVNGNYMENNAGIGILDGMMAQMNPYHIYPVVNAQNLVMVNYPGFASENDGEMMLRYSQSLKAVFRDIVWPGISTISERSNAGLTCMISPQMDYLDGIEPEDDVLVYYMKLLREHNTEAGLSGVYYQADGIGGKLGADAALFGRVLPDYHMLSFYQGNLSDTELETSQQEEILKSVRTVYQDLDLTARPVDYLQEGVTVQRATNDGYSHTYSEDILMNGIETALAYTSIHTDIGKVSYPKTQEDSWEKLFDKFASNTDTYWRAYGVFDGTTLTESDLRIREFLALNYTQRREGNELWLDISNLGEHAYFILHINGEEILSANGAVYDKIEEGAYLIDATEAKVQITFGPSDERVFYE